AEELDRGVCEQIAGPPLGIRGANDNLAFRKIFKIDALAQLVMDDGGEAGSGFAQGFVDRLQLLIGEPNRIDDSLDALEQLEDRVPSVTCFQGGGGILQRLRVDQQRIVDL